MEVRVASMFLYSYSPWWTYSLSRPPLGGPAPPFPPPPYQGLHGQQLALHHVPHHGLRGATILREVCRGSERVYVCVGGK